MSEYTRQPSKPPGIQWRQALVGLLGAVALCGMLMPAIGAGAAPKGSTVADGEHIARLICSACHVVASDQEFPPILNKPAPSFKDIANRPGTTAESLQRFIASTHWDVDTIPMTMPNPMLDKEQITAVSRYILSLRSH